MFEKLFYGGIKRLYIKGRVYNQFEMLFRELTSKLIFTDSENIPQIKEMELTTDIYGINLPIKRSVELTEASNRFFVLSRMRRNNTKVMTQFDKQVRNKHKRERERERERVCVCGRGGRWPEKASKDGT